MSQKSHQKWSRQKVHSEYIQTETNGIVGLLSTLFFYPHNILSYLLSSLTTFLQCSPLNPAISSTLTLPMSITATIPHRICDVWGEGERREAPGGGCSMFGIIFVLDDLLLMTQTLARTTFSIYHKWIYVSLLPPLRIFRHYFTLFLEYCLHQTWADSWVAVSSV